MKIKPILLIAPPVLAAAALWILQPASPWQALGEYFRPATVVMLPLPEGCAPTGESPPPRLMRIIESQPSFYRLSLQKIVVCRTPRRASPTEAFTGQIRKQWLPLYVGGCCSYQFRRHVAIMIADADETGTVIVEAALLQTRWEYLRRDWRTDRSDWYP